MVISARALYCKAVTGINIYNFRRCSYFKEIFSVVKPFQLFYNFYILSFRRKGEKQTLSCNIRFARYSEPFGALEDVYKRQALSMLRADCVICSKRHNLRQKGSKKPSSS